MSSAKVVLVGEGEDRRRGLGFPGGCRSGCRGLRVGLRGVRSGGMGESLSLSLPLLLLLSLSSKFFLFLFFFFTFAFGGWLAFQGMGERDDDRRGFP